MIFEFYSCFIVKNMNDLFSIVKKINITKNELLQCINNNIDTLNHKNNNGKTFFMIFIINIIKIFIHHSMKSLNIFLNYILNMIMI